MGKHKHKKHKHKKKRTHSSSSSSEEIEWVESKQNSSPQYKANTNDSQKDTPNISEEGNDWLTACLKSTSEPPKKIKKKEDERVEELGQHTRELNPYWKNGGCGLPSDNHKDDLPITPTFGDGGYSWYKRAYQRILETAKAENRDPEDIARERWGSLDKLKQLIKSSEISLNKDNPKLYLKEKHARKERRRDTNNDYLDAGRSLNDECSIKRKEDNMKHFITKKDPRNKYSFLKDDIKCTTVSSLHQSTEQYFKKPDFTEKKFVASNLKEVDDIISKKELLSTPENNFETSCKANKKMDIEIESTEPESSSMTTSPIRALTDSEMNQLSAKIIKAELRGDDALVSELKAQLAAAQKAEKEVILTRTDSKGFTHPIIQSSKHQASNKKKQKFKYQTHDQSGKRTCYLPDDNEYSLKQMFQREKMITPNEQNSLFMNAASKMGIGIDDFDDDLISKAARMKPTSLGGERINAIHDHQKLTSIIDKCPYCSDNSLNKHLIIEHLSNIFLTLPATCSLVSGHCLIVPMAHISSSLLLDENVYSEINDLCRRLVDFFAPQGKEPIFLESSKGRFYHTFIECIPVDKDIAADAPIYFKKAILESDTEWSDNKKLIDLYKKDLRHSIPKNLPYFAVRFGLKGGFAHVIEDRDYFPKYFGQEILGNLLDVEPRLWRNPRYQKYHEQCEKKLQFLKLWNG